MGILNEHEAQPVLNAIHTFVLAGTAQMESAPVLNQILDSDDDLAVVTHAKRAGLEVGFELLKIEPSIEVLYP
jgi:hypothetical protein